MNTTKTLFIVAALATTASFSFAQAPAAPKAAHAALAPVNAKAPTHAAAKRMHAKKHHTAQKKHTKLTTKATGSAAP